MSHWIRASNSIFSKKINSNRQWSCIISFLNPAGVQWSCISLSSLTPARAAWGGPWWVWPHRSPCSCRRGQEQTDGNRNVNKSELMHSHLQWLFYDSFDIPTIYLTVVKKLDTFLEKRKGCNIFFLVLWVRACSQMTTSAWPHIWLAKLGRRVDDSTYVVSWIRM